MDLDNKALGVLGTYVLICQQGDTFTVECNQCSQGDYLWSEDRELDFALGNDVLTQAWKHVLTRHREDIADLIGVSESEEKEAVASIARAYAKESS